MSLMMMMAIIIIMTTVKLLIQDGSHILAGNLRLMF